MVCLEIRGPRRFEEPPATPGEPNLVAALDHLAPRFREAVHAAADTYRRLGVRAVLVGGVAASAYGRPRGTKDVDFLVGDEAWDTYGVVISLKAGIPQEACQVPIDNIPVHVKYRELYERAIETAIESDEPGVWIPRPEMVAVTKLAGSRSQDIAAVVDMMRAGSINLDELANLVRPHERLRLAYNRALHELEQDE